MQKLIISILFLLSVNIAISQTSTDLWQDHFSYSNIISVCETNNNTIVGAAKNGLLLINSDGSIEKLSKTSGLSDVDISAMNYCTNLNAIIVGYSNGNIDIISESGIINIADIKRKNINVEKQINSITIQNNDAYLSCGFGIIKLSIENTEISDTYFIGANASFVNVNKTIIINDSIFAATEQGLFSASTNVFLADFNNWTLHFSSNFNAFIDIVSFNNKLYALAVNNSSTIQLIKQSAGNYLVINTDAGENPSIYVNDNLYLVNDSEILKYNTSDNITETITSYGLWDFRPQHIYFKSNKELIIGDHFCGVVTQPNYSFYRSEGVYLNESFKIKTYENTVFVARGGFKDNGTSLWNKAAVSVRSDDNWTNIVNSDARDYVGIIADNADLSHFFVNSWGYGLFEYQNEELINHYNQDNSPLETLMPGPYLKISGLAFDAEKNLWILSAANNYSINILKNDGTWKSLLLNRVLSNSITGDLVYTNNNQIWASIPNRGLFVLDYNNTLDNEGDDIYNLFYPRDKDSELIGVKITCLAEDKDGEIWFGTNEGIGVIYEPLSFDGTTPQADRVKITSELNDSLVTSYLLQNDQVNCIFIDGGNRKWFGTSSSGAYLMNENGTKELLHFTTDNSPLPSNKILSISVEQNSGEVYFSTTKGVVSYKGTSTEGNSIFENVYAYPNPVRHDYSGLIYIKGLVRNSDVKITDIAGNIVYQTKSNGGMATWNGNNFDGQRVSSGIYLIFCSNTDGSDTFVSKLLFIK